MPTTELPQYAEIKRRLIGEIRSGQWSVGATFPSEAELVARYKVSRSTLVRSLQELVREGYLYRRQGQGTFVADYRHRQGNATPLPLFIHGNPASARASHVLLRMLAGIESALGPGLPGITIRQVPRGPLDEETRTLVSSLKPRVALIVEPSFNPELVALLRSLGCIIWSMNEPMDNSNCIYIDQECAGYMATKYLLDQGRRRVALLNGPHGAYWGFAAKHRGYRRALDDAGIEFDPRLAVEGQHTVDSEAGRAMLRGLIDDGVEVDGVVGVSDAKAIGAMALAQELGWRIPHDIAFISIDNVIADQADPPLTAVTMPFEEVGRQSAHRAKESLEHAAGAEAIFSVQQIRLQPSLQVRPGATPSQ
jgi:DNA-binding LacI/PurR family transcriptional regulator